MAVELSTIPLYLYGRYSVKTPAEFANDPRYYDPIVGAVRGSFASFLSVADFANVWLRFQVSSPRRCFISALLAIFFSQ